LSTFSQALTLSTRKLILARGGYPQSLASQQERVKCLGHTVTVQESSFSTTVLACAPLRLSADYKSLICRGLQGQHWHSAWGGVTVADQDACHCAQEPRLEFVRALSVPWSHGGGASSSLLRGAHAKVPAHTWQGNGYVLVSRVQGKLGYGVGERLYLWCNFALHTPLMGRHAR